MAIANGAGPYQFTDGNTDAPAGSMAITSNATGAGKLFVSDGTKWQYAAIS